MYKTKVINESSSNITLKEGNAGVYSLLGTLVTNGSTILNVSPSATYREYWIAVDSEVSGFKIILTSDDCMEYKEVKIVEEENKIGWTGTPRNKSKGSIFSRMFRVFSTSELEESDKIGDKGTEDKEDVEGAKGKSEEHKEDPKPEQSQDQAGDKDAEKIEASGIK